MKNLKTYQEWLRKENNDNPVSVRPETPQAFNFQTLWIPIYSGNRTATLDLNHTIGDFDSDGKLWGYNGNCETPYVIVEVPKSWTDATVEELAKRVAKKMNKPKGYPVDRVLKADNRLPIITETISEML